jgi:surface protein
MIVPTYFMVIHFKKIIQENLITKTGKKMKNYLLLGAVAMGLLSSCSNDELISSRTNQKEAITFSTYVNKTTRAVDVTNSNIGGTQDDDGNETSTNGFAVYGWTTPLEGDIERVFDNERVYGTVGNLGYKKVQYWEEGNSYKFHAIAPFGNDEDTKNATTWKRHWTITPDADDKAKATITFVNNDGTNATGDQDLVYGYYSVASAKEKNNDAINFEFSHLLSRIKFRFEGTSDNPTSVTIKAKDVTLKGSIGTADIEIDNGTATKSSGTSLADVAWSFGDADAVDLNFGDTEGFTTGKIETGSKYIIPDIENEVCYSATVTFELTAEVGDGDTKTYRTYTKEKSFELKPVQMKIGYSYVYVISVNTAGKSGSNSLIDPIAVNADVELWDGTWAEYTTEKNYVIATVKPSSTENVTRFLREIIYHDPGEEAFDISQVERMYIDGVKLESPVASYLFSDTDEHQLKVVMKDDAFTTARIMFYGCQDITSLDLSNFDTSKVTSMYWMFTACYGLTSLDLSSFDTSSVTTMSHMFSESTELASVDLSSFNTSQVTDMSCMFLWCKSLELLNLSSFNTSSVTTMASMFAQCQSLTTLDLSNFDTSQVTDMSSMFGSCCGLTTLDLSNFDTNQVTDMSEMFSGCTNLTSLTMMGELTSLLSVSNMFSGIETTGTFYYNKNVDYSKIIEVLPINWTATPIDPK